VWEIAHHLKFAGASIGASGTAARCAQVEAASTNEAIDVSPAMINDVEK
jgi:hypothetical protein